MPTLRRPAHRRRFSDHRSPVQALELRLLLSAATADTEQALLVRFRDGVDAGAQLIARTQIDASLPLVSGLFRIEIGTGLSLDDALAGYRDNANVLYAQADVELSIDQIPNDHFFGQLWGLHNVGQSAGRADADIDAAEAWDLTVGSSSIVVGVIDTGVDFNHPDLAANIWANTDEIAANGLDDDGNGFVDDIRGWDFVNNDANPMDDNNHGTHVAGTIGAVGNNGIGVAGVAWNVKLMPLKFLSASGSGSTSNAIRAIDYAVANGAKILNNSWGGGGYSQALFDAIERARQAGVIFVAAAGNSARNNDSIPNYPSNYSPDNVVAVASTDRNDNLSSFSNWGATTVDLAAPGSSIVSTLPGNRYGTFSGTSMATPHVAGALALVWSAFPQLTYRQVIDRVLDNVDPLTSLAGRVATGGRLNVFEALSGAPSDTSGPRVTNATWLGTGGINGVRLTFSEPINAGSFDASDVALSGPGGPISVQGVSPVSGSNGTQFDVAFASQTAPGTYQITVGPQIADPAGNAMDQDSDGVLGEATQDQFTATHVVADNAPRTYSWSGSTLIPIHTRVLIPIFVTENVTIDDLNVRVAVSHTNVGSVLLTLIAPDGTRVNLFSNRGGTGDDILATFDDEAALAIAAGAAPFNGSFRPEQLLSQLDGRSTVGTWTLEIRNPSTSVAGVATLFELIVAPRISAAGGEASLGLAADRPAESDDPASPGLLALVAATGQSDIGWLHVRATPVAISTVGGVRDLRVSLGSEGRSSTEVRRNSTRPARSHADPSTTVDDSFADLALACAPAARDAALAALAGR